MTKVDKLLIEGKVKEAVERSMEISGLETWRNETPLSLERGLK